MKIKSEIKFMYDSSMRYSTFFGSFLFWAFAILFLLIFNQYNLAFKFFVATIIIKVIEYAIKVIYRTRRPAINTKAISFLEKFHDFGSMPSGHASVIALFTTMVHLNYGNIYLTLLFVIASLLSGLSRIYLKRHYVKDVVVGYAIGFLIGYFSSKGF